MANINDILGKINALKSEEKIPVTIPSLNKQLLFTPLNVKQQKNLLRQSIGGVMSLPDLLAEFNEIVLESCKESSDSLKVYDRYPVLLELRKNAYGNIIEIKDKKYDISTLPSPTQPPDSLNQDEVSYKTLRVKVKAPSLKDDTGFIKKSSFENKKNKVDNEKDLISGMYVLEILKHIESISFEDSVITFSDLPFDEKISIVENLPLSLNQKILNFIAKIRDFENNLITFEDGAVLPIDTLFATAE